MRDRPVSMKEGTIDVAGCTETEIFMFQLDKNITILIKYEKHFYSFMSVVKITGGSLKMQR